MLSLSLVIFASISNACYETLDRHFFESVFKKLNPKFWYMYESWKYAKKIFGYKIDGWHLFKSAMIVALVFAIVLYKPIINWWADILIYGTTWNMTFGLFYSKLLRRNGTTTNT